MARKTIIGLPIQRRVVRMFMKHPELTQAEIATALNLSQPTVSQITTKYLLKNANTRS